MRLPVASGGDDSVGDIAGPGQARVGETVVITSEGTLRSFPDDVTMLSLLGYDDAGVLGDIVITEVTLAGGTELANREEPPRREDGDTYSNTIHIRHDKRAVKYTASAEVTCVAPGEVRSASRPAVIFGLPWLYEDDDSGGCLGCEHAFTCVE